MHELRFERGDLERFAAASHDTNPLHLDAEYARRTPYAEPIVFGILGVIASLGTLSARPKQSLASASISFHGPLLVGVAYSVHAAAANANNVKITIDDGGRLLATIKLTFRDAAGASFDAPAECQRRTAERWQHTDLRPGVEVVGRYAPTPKPLADLIECWRLADKGVPAEQLAVFLWASYLVGMELPGERAAFSRLRITFPEVQREGEAPAEPPLEYTARVADFDERFDLLEVSAVIQRQGSKVAEATLWSQVRRDPPVLSLAELAARLRPSQILAGKTALVTGGSRGLGAAIVAALCSQGCHLLANYRNGQNEAEEMQKMLQIAGGSVELARGNAADPEWCAALARQIAAQGTGVDILVCNASPPIRPLAVSDQTQERFRQFVEQSVALVTAPLEAFLEMTAARQGFVVLISSEYVRTAPADFPHYVAAKMAAEEIIAAAANRHPATHFIVARPGRVLTDQTNTPTAREGAMPVEHVAAAIVSRILSAKSSETVEILENFDGPRGV